MRWAVPSSKVGSRDSASAAAERDSAVDAEGLAGGAWAGAGLACTCAAGEGAGISLWPKAGTAMRRTAAGTTNWRMSKIPNQKASRSIYRRGGLAASEYQFQSTRKYDRSVAFRLSRNCGF